jgi:hypothetical protein
MPEAAAQTVQHRTTSTKDRWFKFGRTQNWEQNVVKNVKN